MGNTHAEIGNTHSKFGIEWTFENDKILV